MELTQLPLRREWHADARFEISDADTHIAIENPSRTHPVHFTFTDTDALPTAEVGRSPKVAPFTGRGMVLSEGYLWLAGDDNRQVAVVLTE